MTKTEAFLQPSDVLSRSFGRTEVHCNRFLLCGLWSGGRPPRSLNFTTTLLLAVSLRPWWFYPLWKNPGTHWSGGWVGHRASLGTAVTRRRILAHNENPNRGRPARSLVTALTELSYCMSSWCFINIQLVTDGAYYIPHNVWFSTADTADDGI
jgi:hypothetical protein